MNDMMKHLPLISAVLGTALIVLLLITLLIKYFATVFKSESKASLFLSKGSSAEHRPGNWKNAVLQALVWFAVSRAFILLATCVYAKLCGNEAYFANMYAHWTKWDAPHYLGLIKNWYVNEGDPRFHIVFFPMYPLVCRMLLPLFGGNADVSAMVVSNICACIAGALVYQIAALEYGERTGTRAVRFFFLNPLSFFLSLPYTESLFLLLTMAAVYLARRRRYAFALIAGAMCAACRLMGIVVAIPVFYAMLADDREKGLLSLKRTAVRFVSCFVILLGVAAYLFLNWKVTGNPFQFWIYQEEHWHNTTGTLWNTFRYIFDYALYTDNSAMRMGTWVPTIVLIYAAVALLWLHARRSNAGDAAYGWAYMYMTIVPTWLISGPRYVSGLYCLYPMLADAARRKWVDWALSIVFVLGLGYMSCMFVFFSGVY
ncbi:MAG: glycosyltransferase family 39 protein [Clostridia bacterium]|nr:glycosyltransferase family 39 protein [Clostridia bacterium]